MLLTESFADFHHILHTYEGWILAVSGALVAAGGALEALARRAGHNHGFPWLFAISAACFVANLSIILAHRAT